MKRILLRWGLIVACSELPTGCETVGDVLTSADSSGGNAGESGSGGEDSQAFPYSGAPSDLTAGDAQTCFIDGGHAFCFGGGAEGQLGTGRQDEEAVPVRVGTADDYVMIRSGGQFTCALREGGELECTGEGETGALGDGAGENQLSFVSVRLDQKVAHFSTGQAHVCAITDDGALYCWGKNTEGQLGLGDPFPDVGVDRFSPVQVEPDKKFGDVSAGQGHTCAVDADGSLLCWGRNSQNQLGLGEGAEGQLRIPTRVGEDQDWARVAAGQDHTCAQKTSGALYCWGVNGAGQLGLGDQESRNEPALVTPADVLEFDLDTFHTCVIRSTGAFCTGRGIEGALGTGTSDQSSLVLAPSSSAAEQVAVGRFHTCIRQPETIRCTGENGNGRLGVGDLERRSAFTELAQPMP